MGHITAGLSGGAVPYWVGVLLLGLVVVVYETVGGMRAVAWTDTVQGLMLVVGLTGLLIAVSPTPTHLAGLTEWIATESPEKVAVPGWDVCRNWFSTLVLIGFSAAVYPHAIQRIYAARDSAALKRSFSVMVFLPLVTTGSVFLVGILAIEQLAGAGPIEADQVLPLLLTQWSESSPVLYALSLLVIVAVVSAIMSTADSVLLSLSSILAKDILGTTVLHGADEARLTRTGKLVSWILVAAMVGIALNPRITLWGLTEVKMEILAQGGTALRTRSELGQAHDPRGADRYGDGHDRIRRTARDRPQRAVGHPRRGCRAACQSAGVRHAIDGRSQASPWCSNERSRVTLLLTMGIWN